MPAIRDPSEPRPSSKKPNNGILSGAAAGHHHRDRKGWMSKIGEVIGLSRQPTRTAVEPFNPFKKPQPPPPGVLPKDHDKNKLAMDWAPFEGDDGLFAWAADADYNSMFAEGQGFLGYSYLAQLAQRAEYRIFSDVLSTEMTRKWIKFQAASDEDKTDKIKELSDYLDELGLREAMRDVAEYDGYMGRSHLYIDTGDGDDREELMKSIGNGRDSTSKVKLKKGCLKAFRPVEAIWCYPTNYNSNDPLRADWYNPTSWFVMGKEVHVTRLLKFVGREVPDLLKPAYSFGGLSISQMAKPYVDNWLRTRQSVSDLLHAFTVFVLETNLGEALAGDGDQLFKRIDLFNNLRDNRGLMVTNKDTEGFSNVSAPLGTLDALQAQSQEQMCSVGRIPTVKFTGIDPHGLNASSDGSIRTFYDTIHAYQERFYCGNNQVNRSNHLRTCIDIAQISLWGEVDADITFAFHPLVELTEKDQADLRKSDVETGQILIDTGVISPQEERTRIAKDETSPYQGLDPNDMPELLQEEEEGLIPEGSGKGLEAELEGGGEETDEDREARDAGIVPFTPSR